MQDRVYCTIAAAFEFHLIFSDGSRYFIDDCAKLQYVALYTQIIRRHQFLAVGHTDAELLHIGQLGFPDHGALGLQIIQSRYIAVAVESPSMTIVRLSSSEP